VYTLDGKLKDRAAQLPVPGTYKTWRQIDPPAWASVIALRPLDDPAVDAALARLDKKRHRGTSMPAVEKVWLTVPYERKDEAKKIGARWSPGDKAWWLSADNAVAINEARVLGFAS
jgi:hypothetical protein